MSLPLAPVPQEVVRRPLTSRILHRLGDLSASAGAAVIAAAISLAFLVAALVASRSGPLLTDFEALAAAVTLVMVFALQHSQAQQQTALQRKLDEILRVLPGADTRLVHFETGSIDQFDEVEERHSAVGALARAEEVSSSPEHGHGCLAN
jgi:low affinity Fe/Cu permease